MHQNDRLAPAQKPQQPTKISSLKDRQVILHPPPLQNPLYNKTIKPRTPTTAANPAIPAGLSAPPFGTVCGLVAVGGVTEFVGAAAPVVPFDVVKGLPVPLADGIIIPLETVTADAFADTCAKVELGVTVVGGDVDTIVAFEGEEERGEVVGAGVACAVAEYADTSSSYWLTMGAISCLTSVASACRKLVMTGWREDGMAVTQAGKGAEAALM